MSNFCFDSEGDKTAVNPVYGSVGSMHGCPATRSVLAGKEKSGQNTPRAACTNASATTETGAIALVAKPGFSYEFVSSSAALVAEKENRVSPTKAKDADTRSPQNNMQRVISEPKSKVPPVATQAAAVESVKKLPGNINSVTSTWAATSRTPACGSVCIVDDKAEHTEPNISESSAASLRQKLNQSAPNPTVYSMKRPRNTTIGGYGISHHKMAQLENRLKGRRPNAGEIAGNGSGASAYQTIGTNVADVNDASGVNCPCKISIPASAPLLKIGAKTANSVSGHSKLSSTDLCTRAEKTQQLVATRGPAVFAAPTIHTSATAGSEMLVASPEPTSNAFKKQRCDQSSMISNLDVDLFLSRLHS